MQRHTLQVIFLVDVDAQVNQLLLCLESRISCSRAHIHCNMQKVPSLVVQFINVCSLLYKPGNLRLIPPNQSKLEQELPLIIHMVDIRAQFQ